MGILSFVNVYFSKIQEYVREVERNWGNLPGEKKRDLVIKALQVYLTMIKSDVPAREELEEIIDHIVEIQNLLGIFKHRER